MILRSCNFDFTDIQFLPAASIESALASILAASDPLFNPHPVLQPILDKIPMKPQVPQTAASPRECVRAKPSGTKVPSLSRKLIPNTKNISCRDALLTDHTTSTPSPRRASPIRILSAGE
jgi:hypothetical protein